MRLSTSRKLALALLVFAGAMMTHSLLRAPARADITTARQDAAASSRDPYAIRLRRGVIDTRARRDLDTSAQDRATHGEELSAAHRATPAELRLIQLAGPTRRAWLERLEAAGAEVVCYVPNYAYVIRGTPAALGRVAVLDAGEMADDARPLRWMGRLDAVQKLDPVFSDERLAAAGSDGVDVEIELIDDAAAEQAISQIVARSNAVVRAPRRPTSS